MSLIKFFPAPVGTYGNAAVNWLRKPEEELVAYAASYWGAAMNLVAFREHRGMGSIDHAALPILYLYRHAFELYLKTVVYRAAVVSIKPQELSLAIPRLWHEHSLVALVDMSRPLIRSNTHHLTVSGELAGKVEWLVSEIDKIDPGSYTFRYPVTSRGNPSFGGMFVTNIFSFSETVESVLDDVAQFCRSLEHECVEASQQMKLALHPIRSEPAQQSPATDRRTAGRSGGS